MRIYRNGGAITAYTILHVRAVALLILMTRATRTKFIATDFRLVTHYSLNLAASSPAGAAPWFGPVNVSDVERLGMRR